MADEVILVNCDDQVLGTMPKLQAHLEGKLHRAFSVFIFNTSGELLMQQRAFGKYHSAGKWTNTCCSHPKPEEDTEDAAVRRLLEEMGMYCELAHKFSFRYDAKVGNGLIENEFDHVYFGVSNQVPQPNPDEVYAFKYMSMESLNEDLRKNTDQYTEWLKVCFYRVLFYHHKMFDNE